MPKTAAAAPASVPSAHSNGTSAVASAAPPASLTTAAAKAAVSDLLDKFKFKPQPEGQKLINECIADFLKHNPSAAGLARRMKSETGTRFADWIDHIQVGSTATVKKRLIDCGFTLHPQPMADECYMHDGAMFPAIVLVAGKSVRIGVKVESIMDFLVAQNINEGEIHGEPGGQFRMATAFKGADGYDLFIVERHGYRGFAAPNFDAVKAAKAARHAEALKRRRREFDNDLDGFRELTRLVDAAIADLGRDWACDLFFAAEREYWMRRNRAAQVQYARQEKLGLGWANHDHHTYRCIARALHQARRASGKSSALYCRERFYAGREAGWGAQVMEQPATGIITFNDVDMSPEELLGDFSHEGFKSRATELGTVGLWCGLHGEAVLQAGMHHLECQFDWHALVEQLEQHAAHPDDGPRSPTFPYLRQAFTEGEHWQVERERLQRLLGQQPHHAPSRPTAFRAGRRHRFSTWKTSSATTASRASTRKASATSSPAPIPASSRRCRCTRSAHRSRLGVFRGSG